MAEINLLDRYPKSARPIEERGRRKLSGGDRLMPRSGNLDNTEVLVEQKLLEIARQFGQAYFDGDRLYGYGGYSYHPRFWTETVARFRDYYKLEEDASVLDVGCAKGFMLYDFKKLMPRLNVVGIDISRYAYENSLPEIRPFLQIGNAKKLPFADQSFDLVISINTVHNLPPEECRQALREIRRVTRRHAFISVDAWKTPEEKARLLQWNITAQTYMHADDWKKLFDEVGYDGDYTWFTP